MSTATASKSYQHRGRHNPVKNQGKPHRKIAAKLDARVKDFSAMMDRLGTKAPIGAFHCPGSRQR
jgi:hypothetical protein